MMSLNIQSDNLLEKEIHNLDRHKLHGITRRLNDDQSLKELYFSIFRNPIVLKMVKILKPFSHIEVNWGMLSQMKMSLH